MNQPLTAEDLAAVHEILPYTARVLIQILGPAAVDLLNARSGCEIRIPKHADRHPEGAARWAELAGIVGADGMCALAAHYGGDILVIPSLLEARNELRARAIRAEFDRLTAGGKMSGRRAIYEINLKFAPITSRAIEKICGRPDALSRARQGSLF